MWTFQTMFLNLWVCILIAKIAICRHLMYKNNTVIHKIYWKKIILLFLYYILFFPLIFLEVLIFFFLLNNLWNPIMCPSCLSDSYMINILEKNIIYPEHKPFSHLTQNIMNILLYTRKLVMCLVRTGRFMYQILIKIGKMWFIDNCGMCIFHVLWFVFFLRYI